MSRYFGSYGARTVIWTRAVSYLDSKSEQCSFVIRRPETCVGMFQTALLWVTTLCLLG